MICSDERLLDRMNSGMNWVYDTTGFSVLRLRVSLTCLYFCSLVAIGLAIPFMPDVPNQALSVILLLVFYFHVSRDYRKMKADVRNEHRLDDEAVLTKYLLDATIERMTGYFTRVISVLWLSLMIALTIVDVFVLKDRVMPYMVNTIGLVGLSLGVTLLEYATCLYPRHPDHRRRRQQEKASEKVDPFALGVPA